ncbi:MAG: hypothetical protein K0R67_645 [Paenibacillus sp.]|nr:hypothetical protein [Paenibacillus sp.]
MIKCVIDTGLTLYRVERKPVIVLLVMVVLSVPIIPLELGVIQLLIDRIQQWSASVSFRPIVEMVIWLAIVMIMNNIVIGLPMPLAMTRLSEIGTLEERRLILRKNCRLPLALIESPKVKDLRLKALQISLYGCYNTGIHLLQMALQIVVLMAILLVYDQWIPVVGVILTLCVLLYASLRTSKQIEQVKRDQTPSTRLLKHYAELITKRETAKEVRLFGLGRLLTERWVALYETQSSIRQNVIRASELLLMGPQLLAALFSGIILALLVLLPGKEGLSAGSYAMLFLTLTTNR